MINDASRGFINIYIPNGGGDRIPERINHRISDSRALELMSGKYSIASYKIPALDISSDNIVWCSSERRLPS